MRIHLCVSVASSDWRERVVKKKAQVPMVGKRGSPTGLKSSAVARSREPVEPVSALLFSHFQSLENFSAIFPMLGRQSSRPWKSGSVGDVQPSPKASTVAR